MLARLPEKFEMEQAEIMAAWEKDSEGLCAIDYFPKHLSPEFKAYREARDREIAELKAQGCI